MAEIHDFDPTDASNTGRWPENMAPSAVNNAGRADEGIIARWEKDVNFSVVATISASLITMTANRSSLTLTGTTSDYIADLVMAFTMGANPNTGPVRVTINTIGPISLRDNKGISLSSSMLLAGTRVMMVKDGTNDYFRLVSPELTRITTRGDIIRGSSVGAAERLAVGTNGQLLASDGTDAAWGGAGILETEKATTSGATIDFTGIPSWVKQITVMLTGVSTSGTSSMIIQIGDAGGIETTGYLGSVAALNGTTPTSGTATNGLAITNASVAAGAYHGRAVFSLEDAANNTWVASSVLSRGTSASVHWASTAKSLTATLDRVRLTTSGGTDTFDAGAVNILYE